jgi:hypothetical protein
MKNIALLLIALIGLYTFLRNNIGLLPDQVMWISSPNVFYKVFLPLLMSASAAAALIKKEKANIQYLSFVAMFIDAINRMASLVNYYYEYLTYTQIEKIEPTAGVTIVRSSLIPSFIMLFIEAFMIFYVFRWLLNINRLKVKVSS